MPDKETLFIVVDVKMIMWLRFWKESLSLRNACWNTSRFLKCSTCASRRITFCTEPRRWREKRWRNLSWKGTWLPKGYKILSVYVSMCRVFQYLTSLLKALSNKYFEIKNGLKSIFPFQCYTLFSGNNYKIHTPQGTKIVISTLHVRHTL